MNIRIDARREREKSKSKSMKRSSEEVEGKPIPAQSGYKPKKMFDPDLCEIKIQMVHLRLCRTHRVVVAAAAAVRPIRFEFFIFFQRNVDDTMWKLH